MPPSIASAPELQKNIVSANEFSTSRFASFSPLPTRNRFDVCQSFEPCSVSALTRCGWQWPSAFTAMPEVKSK